MKSKKPYFIRAVYEWIVDHNNTPYIIVDANVQGVNVPKHAIEDGQVILDISPAAVKNLFLHNSHIEFEASFNQVPTQVIVPAQAVMGIVGKEDGEGMMFPEDHGDYDPPPSDDHSEGDTSSGESSTGKGKPKLRII